MIYFQRDPCRDLPFRITDVQITAAKGGALTSFNERSPDTSRRFIDINLGQLQTFQLFRLGACLRRGTRAGFVLRNEFFQIATFGHDRRIRTNQMLLLFSLIDEKRINFTGIHREFSACQIKCMATRRCEKRPVM